MSGFPGEVAVAIVVVGVILILFCVFIGIVMYYGCAAVCCCCNEKYDVCDHAAQERAKKRGGDGTLLDGTAGATLNPLMPFEASVMDSHGSPLTPLDETRALSQQRGAADVSDFTARAGVEKDAEEERAFDMEKMTSAVEAAVVSSAASGATLSTGTPSTACIYLHPVASESTTAHVTINPEL